MQEWQNVFIVAAEIYLFGAIVYAILARGDEQWWADGAKKQNFKKLPLLNSDNKK